MIETHTETPAPIVRLAVRDDEDALVAMVREMHGDTEWYGSRAANGELFPFDEMKARVIVQSAVLPLRNHPDAGQAWIGVIGNPGALLASVCVSVMEATLSQGRSLFEHWNWARPESRSAVVNEALLAFSTARADELGLSLSGVASAAYGRMAKSRFYERRLGPAIGRIYHYAPRGLG